MFLCPNTPLSTPFSNTLSLRRSIDVNGHLRAVVHTVSNFRAPLSGVALYCYVSTAYCWKMATLMFMIHGDDGDISSN